MDLATVICTPNKCCNMNCICFICDVTICIEIPNFISLFSFCGVIFPLDLTMFIENVHKFLADFNFETRYLLLKFYSIYFTVLCGCF